MHRILTFSINQKQHGDKVPQTNLFVEHYYAGHFCDLPYMLARFLGESATISQPGSPFTGGNFVTHLEKSYGVLILGMIATLTCVRAKNITISFLENMHVVKLVRGVYVISTDDPVEPLEQVEEPR